MFHCNKLKLKIFLKINLLLKICSFQFSLFLHTIQNYYTETIFYTNPGSEKPLNIL